MKIVQVWAEKELRNLKRLAFCDGLVKCPKPYYFKNNIIMMDLIGNEG